MKILNQTGDTIIEVLLAMTIIGLILAGAYATSSRSLNTSQYSQERTRATRIAESQIEQIKSLGIAISDPRLVGSFCIDISQAQPIIAIAGGAPFPAGCVEETFFNKSLSLSGDTYTIVVDWTPPGGSDSNKANVTLVYRNP